MNISGHVALSTRQHSALDVVSGVTKRCPAKNVFPHVSVIRCFLFTFLWYAQNMINYIAIDSEVSLTYI